jgi:copper chaperone CopZ
MKKFILPLLMLLILAGTALAAGTKQAGIKVLGNCKSCKKTIESALKDVKGIEQAEWDKNTKILNVRFDESLINQQQIEEKVAAKGYDTENVKASDDTYNNLHSCCKYDRKKP